MSSPVPSRAADPVRSGEEHGAPAGGPAGGAPEGPIPETAALVHDWLTGMRGGEKVLESLLEILPGAPIHTLFHFPGSVSEKIEAHPIRTSFLQRAPGVRRHYRRYLPLFPAAIEDFDLTGFPLVVSTSHCVAKGVIPAPDAYHVCYCHTPMRYAWDQEHAYFPRRRGLTARLRNLVLSYLRAWDVASAPRVDLFVANSRFVARRIRRYYGRDAAVVPPPVDVEFFTPGEARDEAGEVPRDEPYALAVSALVPYKRLDLAVEACRAAGLELKVVGTGPDLVDLHRSSSDVARFLGRVDAHQLRRLYRGAHLFLQPGVEDFGIAAVESLACGTPVVALARGGVLDIVEDGKHGVLYRPQGPGDRAHLEALAGAIDKRRQIRFNELDLQRRGASFSRAAFDRSFRQLLASRPSEGRDLRP